jgi:precorrin-2 dehydrogenase/sirohydrochlorin ferrochelatase
VGAGPVAAAKALPLLDEGADLTVVAPDAVDAIAGERRLTWHRRPYAAGDLDGAVLVLAATGVPGVDDEVAKDAAGLGTLCVRVDGGGTAAFASVVRRGPLLLAVSTSGQAPALARRVRQRLEDEFGPEWGEVAALLGELRGSVRLDGLPQAERRRRWRAAVDALLPGGQPRPDREAALGALGDETPRSIS